VRRAQELLLDPEVGLDLAFEGRRELPRRDGVRATGGDEVAHRSRQHEGVVVVVGESVEAGVAFHERSFAGVYGQAPVRSAPSEAVPQLAPQAFRPRTR
jgi:hypothetical protein